MQVLIVEDESAVRPGTIASVRESKPEAEVNVAETLAVAFQQLERFPNTKLVILDLRLPDSRDIHTVARMQEFCERAGISPRIVVLSALQDPALAIDVLQHHAIGFISKNGKDAEFNAGLAATLNGRIFVPDWLIPYFGLESSSCGKFPPSITEREKDVCYGLVDGLTYKRIARRLSISEHTVKNHVASIAQKLNVTQHARAGVVAALGRLKITSRMVDS